MDDLFFAARHLPSPQRENTMILAIILWAALHVSLASAYVFWSSKSARRRRMAACKEVLKNMGISLRPNESVTAAFGRRPSRTPTIRTALRPLPHFAKESQSRESLHFSSTNPSFISSRTG